MVEIISKQLILKGQLEWINFSKSPLNSKKLDRISGQLTQSNVKLQYNFVQ